MNLCDHILSSRLNRTVQHPKTTHRPSIRIQFGRANRSYMAKSARCDSSLAKAYSQEDSYFGQVSIEQRFLRARVQFLDGPNSQLGIGSYVHWFNPGRAKFPIEYWFLCARVQFLDAPNSQLRIGSYVRGFKSWTCQISNWVAALMCAGSIPGRAKFPFE